MVLFLNVAWDLEAKVVLSALRPRLRVYRQQEFIFTIVEFLIFSVNWLFDLYQLF